MHLHAIFALVIFGLLMWAGLTFYFDYRKQTGSMWLKLVAASKDSATILWSRFVAVLGVATIGLDQVAEWLHEPQLQDAIKVVLDPKVVPFYMIAIALVTIWMRHRTLPKA